MMGLRFMTKMSPAARLSFVSQALLLLCCCCCCCCLVGSAAARTVPKESASSQQQQQQQQQNEAAAPAGPKNIGRALQEQAPDFNLAGSTCQSNGKPLLEGSVLENLLADEFQPDCSCVEDSNVDDFNNLASGGFDLDAFSRFFSDLSIESEWSCANQCWTCFPSSDCGIFRANSETDYEGIPTNFTTDDISSLISMELSFADLIQGFQMQEYCLDYTAGLTGQVCWGSTVDIQALDLDVNTTELPCFMAYDGVECNSCVVSSGCWIADCDNHGVPVVNTCDGTGVDSGLFQVLAFYGNTLNPGEQIVAGTCDSAGDTNSTFCAGIAGIACPDGLECVDDPADDCDPAAGGADCGGICVERQIIVGPPTIGPTASQSPTDTPRVIEPVDNTPANTTKAPTEATMEGPPTEAPEASAAADPTTDAPVPVPPPTPNTNAPTVSAAADGKRWGRVVSNGVLICMIVSALVY